MSGKNRKTQKAKTTLCGVPFSSPKIVQNEHSYKILLTKNSGGMISSFGVMVPERRHLNMDPIKGWNVMESISCRDFFGCGMMWGCLGKTGKKH